MHVSMLILLLNFSNVSAVRKIAFLLILLASTYRDFVEVLVVPVITSGFYCVPGLKCLLSVRCKITPFAVDVHPSSYVFPQSALTHVFVAP